MNRVAVYLRTSTQEQHPENQLPALETFCQSRGWDIKGIYSEQESAWREGHQRELARLLSDLRSGKSKFDILLVWALDRLSRQGAASILNLVNGLRVYGVKVVSLQESWTELPGELGEVLFAIAGWVARMESERRSERTKAGLQRVRQHGSKSGRPIGRPAGSKDKQKRDNGGYLLRYHNRPNKGAENTKAKKAG